MAIVTKKKQKRDKRNDDIKALYANLKSDPDSQVYAIYQMIALKYNISETQVGRIVGNIK